MFEKDKSQIFYQRKFYTMEEELYKHYLKLRGVLHDIEAFKYATEDNFSTSEDFKQGFIAGVKIMSSMLIDL